MAYYYSVSSQQSTSASASTDLFLANFKGIAGLRAYIAKLQAGSMANASDVQVRLRLQRTTTLTSGAGTGILPTPQQADGPAAALVAQTLPTIGTGVLGANLIPVQIAYNTRGTGLWAAFVEDEKVSVLGATAPNCELILNSQQSGAVAVAVPFTVYTQE